MLFAGWEVRMLKNCDRGLENAARGRTVSRQITCLYIFFSAVNWFYRLQMGLFTQLLSLNRLARRLLTI